MIQHFGCRPHEATQCRPCKGSADADAFHTYIAELLDGIVGTAKAHHDIHRLGNRTTYGPNNIKIWQSGRVKHIGPCLLERLQASYGVFQVRVSVKEVLGAGCDKKWQILCGFAGCNDPFNSQLIPVNGCRVVTGCVLD